jgi:polyisoprenoid-binding protein YceI
VKGQPALGAVTARKAIAAALLGAAGGAAAQPTVYAIDPTHTFVSFEVAHYGTSITRGRFERQQGHLQFDRAGRGGRVEVSIETASVSTGVAALDRMLQGPDFLDAADYPAAVFSSERFVFDGDQLAEIAGNLTLLGRTHAVTLKASRFNCYLNPLFRRDVCGGDFETTIQRSEWGISTGLPAMASDAVRLLVQIEAVQQ